MRHAHLYEQRIKELFFEAAGVLMTDRETVIADCRAVMEALADCGSIDAEMETVSDEMEVTAGLIQKLVDENATRKLDQHDYRKKYDGYASRYAALESRISCPLFLCALFLYAPHISYYHSVSHVPDVHTDNSHGELVPACSLDKSIKSAILKTVNKLTIR